MLTEDIKNYIYDLKLAFPSITDVWFVGSRANGTARDNSDWDFVVFSSPPIYDDIKGHSHFHREDVDLLLVGEDGEFSKPFGEPKGGSLSRWKWEQVSDVLAHYEGCKWVPDEEATAEGMPDMGELICKTLNGYKI